jgi:vacuolar-type H+-ATPase subunit E/Vma4
MSLSAILEAIRASGDTQVRAIETQAYEQSRILLANARLEAQPIEDLARNAAIAPAFKERARILHRARLEALRIVGDAREALVDAALDQLRGRLVGLRSDPGYPSVMRRITQEALAELEDSLQDLAHVQVMADPRDRSLVENILHDMGLEIPVSYELECLGGLITGSIDGEIVVINTLEARLERAIPSLRRHLAALFEEEQPESAIREHQVRVANN